jgi:aminoacrylate hydrolase
MSKAALDWGALHYDEAGGGDPLLLVSGLNGLAAPWQGIIPGLAERFRVITHDHRGLGRSDAWTGAYSVDQIAADVLGLMDRLGLVRAHIVGHSLGGAVAQAIAADHPGRVGGLVIYASWPGQDAYFNRTMLMRRDVLLHQGVEAFLRTGPLGIYPPRWITENDAALTAALPGAIAAFPGVDKMVARMQACLDHERRAALPRITAPTLVIGMADDVSTPAYSSEEIAAAIPGARLVLLPYGGHNAHQVVPGELRARLLDFLTATAAMRALRGIRE